MLAGLVVVALPGCAALWGFQSVSLAEDDAGDATGLDGATVGEGSTGDGPFGVGPDGPAGADGSNPGDGAVASEGGSPDSAALGPSDGGHDALAYVVDASQVDAGDAGPAPGTCPAPYTAVTPYCPAQCSSTSSCLAGQNAPENYAVVFLTISGTGCGGTGNSTPGPCMACGAFTCACILANLPTNHVCGFGPDGGPYVPTCNGSTGLPTLVCP